MLKINPKRINTKKLKIAAEIIKKGGVVAFPTETVYGLGANTFDENAVRKIFELKGRPPDNPLIVHICRKREIYKLAANVPKIAKDLIKKYWPGPLTLVLKKSEIVPDIVTAGLDTVAIRMPSHRVALKFIELSNVPIAAPSANKSGKPSATNVKHILEDFDYKLDCIIDSGESTIGLESTVLDLTEEPPVILRPGAITKEMLERIIGRVRIETYSEKPKSPGMKYRHYAPDATLILIDGRYEMVRDKIRDVLKKFKNKKIIAVVTDEAKIDIDVDIIRIGSRKDLGKIAKNLFKILREVDEKGYDVILFEGVDERDLGLAVMNRLRKAANIILRP